MVSDNSKNQFCGQLYTAMKGYADVCEERGNKAYFFKGESDEPILQIDRSGEPLIAIKGLQLESKVLGLMISNKIDPDCAEFSEGNGYFIYKLI